MSFAFVARLGEKVDRAGLHGFDGAGDIAAPAEEDDGPRIVRFDQGALQLQAAQAGHGKIDEDAAGRADATLLEKLARR